MNTLNTSAFFTITRGDIMEEKVKDLVYDVYDRLYQRFITFTRVRELEKRYGENSLVFRGVDSIENQETFVYEVGILTEKGLYIQTCDIELSSPTLSFSYSFWDTSRFQRIPLQKTDKLRQHRETLLNYLRELPRFRLYFITGSIQLKE